MKNDYAVIDEILRQTKNIALVGIDENHWRPSYHIGRYLVYYGFRVFPVNPSRKIVIGRYSHASLDDAQDAALDETGQGIDLVDVFLAPEHVPAIVDDVIRLEIPYLWLQDKIENDEAMELASEAGVKCVQNDCLYREYAARPDLHRRPKLLHA